jgi:hypothetical protein
MEERPSGAKAQRLCTFFGTAKAVPFQNGIYATSSSDKNKYVAKMGHPA